MSEKQKKRRAQLSHGLFDTDYGEKDKLVELEETHGGDACWYYTLLQLAMSGATDALISRAKALRVGDARRFKRERTEAIIAFLLDRGMLITEGDMLSAPRVIQDQESLAATQDKWRDRKRKQRECPVGQARDNAQDSGVTAPLLREDIVKNSEGSKSNKSGAPVSRIVQIDEISLMQLSSAQGPDVVQRAIELAEAHIERQKGTPEYLKLVQQAQNGSAFIRSWALSEARRQLHREAAPAPPKPRDFKEEERIARRQRLLGTTP